MTRIGTLTSVSSATAFAAIAAVLAGFHATAAHSASTKVAGGNAAESIAERFSSTSRDEARRKADEQDMLNRARKEAEEAKRNARMPLDGTVSPAPATATKTEQVSKPVNIGTPSPDDTKRLEAQRQEELQRLSEKLRKASQTRTAQPKPVVTPWQTEVTEAPKADIFKNEKSALGMHGDPADIASSRVTVLMVMTPGNKGIRRFDKNADPVLCTNDGCYISQGADVPSRFLTTHKALGFGNTFGLRAGACREQLACVFRSVDLGRQPSFVQPVDMRMVHHDRREIKQVTADETCRIEAGRLNCARPVRASNYTLWIVPEKVAQRAGVEALSRALTEGLGRAQAALQ